PARAVLSAHSGPDRSNRLAPWMEPRPAFTSPRIDAGTGRDACTRPPTRTDQGGLAMYRSIRLTLAILIAAAAGVAAGPARAGEGSVAAEPTATRGTKARGKEVLVPADKAQPGELLEYRALYRNDGKTDARGLMATLPIPLGTQYVAGSAIPRGVQASLD